MTVKMTFKIGDEVTFYYNGLRLTGNITKFETLSAYTDQPADTEVVATVHVPGDTLADRGGDYGALKLSKLRRADHPSAKAAAAVPEQKPGALVRVTGMRARTIAGVSEGSVAVVLADKGDRLNVVAVGGSTDKYQYLRVPRHQVAPVSLDLDALLQRQLFPKSRKPGALVRVTGMCARTIAGVSEGSVAVVLADKGDRINVVAVGGSTDKYRYLRVSRHQVTPVLEGLSQGQLFPPASKPYETDGQSILDALHTVDTEGL